MAALDTTAMKNRAQGAMAGFSTGQRAVVAVATVMLVVGGVFFAQWASKPSMAPLFSNLSTDDASAITTKLQTSKIPFTLTDGGATILVPQNKVYQTRLDMAGQGLPTGGSQGYKLLDKQGLTTSEFMEHTNYQRALEGELDNTINSISGVTGATVHLVIPQADVFSNDSVKPSASVLVQTGSGKTLSSGQVQSIVNLVASSVEGLQPTDVTVADGNGKMLAAPGTDSSAGGDTSDQRATTASQETDLTNKIQAMLTPIVGAGKAVVQSHVDLNFDKSSTTAETYNPLNKTPTASSSSTQSEVVPAGGTGAGTTATGCVGAGTPSNTSACVNPSSTTGVAGSTANGYSNTNVTQDLDVDKQVTQTQKATPAVDRVAVSVLLDSSVPNIDATEVQKLVENAAGVQPARGDSVVVSRMPFDKTAATAASTDLKAAEKAKKSEQTTGLIKTALTFVVILAVLGLLFFMTKKRAANYTSTPLSMAELEAAMPALPSIDATLAGMENSMIDMNSPEALERAKVDKEITDLIERQPDEVANLLRSWLADRRS